MSEQLKTAEEKAAESRRGPGAVRRGGPPHAQIGMPAEKSQNFGPSARRVLGLLRPERLLVWAVVEILLINAQEGPWERPARAPAKKEVVAIVVTVVFVIVVMAIHYALGVSPVG